MQAEMKRDIISAPSLRRCATALTESIGEGMHWCAGLDRRWDVVRRPHIAIDVRQGEAYALSVEEAGEYNPHIA